MCLVTLVITVFGFGLTMLQCVAPWKPVVVDDTDTSNISSEFTSEPAGVTPTPAGTVSVRAGRSLILGTGATARAKKERRKR